jgi:two-component system, NarL family, nitrate/nitrite response regulator NarL
MTNVSFDTAAPIAPLSSLVKTVYVCDTQPLTPVGIRALLGDHAELSFVGSTDSLWDGFDFVDGNPGDVLLIDKAFGIAAICESLIGLREHGVIAPSIVVWGVIISPAEAMRLLRSGARGILRKTAEVAALRACLETVARGRIWVEDCILRDSRPTDHPTNALTAREQEVLELAQQSLANREIALRLNIQLGTVKIHMKHIFEKTGVRGRHSLALASLRNRSGAAAPAANQDSHAVATA